MSLKPTHELHQRRFGRNLGLGLTLAAFVALVFGMTIVKFNAIGERAAAAAQEKGEAN